MKSWSNIYSILFLVILIVFCGHANLYAIDTYTITDLGTLGGWDSSARAINNQGQVVGYFHIAPFSQEIHAYIWDSYKGFQDLGQFIGTEYGSYATDINDNGQVFGYYGGINFLWDQNDGLQYIPDNFYAEAINNFGQLVGSSVVQNDQRHRHAFLYDKGTMVDLGTLIPNGSSSACDINNSGQIVGSADWENYITHAFIWDNSHGMKDIHTLGLESYAIAINDQEQVVGSYRNNEFPGGHAFLWSPNETMIDIGTLGGNVTSVYDINNTGLIIGRSVNNYHEVRCFIWEEGIMYDLENLVMDSCGWRLEEVYGINDLGQIVGWGTNIQENILIPHALLLNPIPEPTVLTLLALGGIALWRKQKRHLK